MHWHIRHCNSLYSSQAFRKCSIWIANKQLAFWGLVSRRHWHFWFKCLWSFNFSTNRKKYNTPYLWDFGICQVFMVPSSAVLYLNFLQKYSCCLVIDSDTLSTCIIQAANMQICCSAIQSLSSEFSARPNRLKHSCQRRLSVTYKKCKPVRSGWGRTQVSKFATYHDLQELSKILAVISL